MSKIVYCDKCLKEIRIRGDLVTTTMFFQVVPYHEDCYAKDLKGAKTFFLSNQPINGFSGNFLSFLAILICISTFFINDETMIYLFFFTLFPIIYRLYSYFIYERHLEK
ncbi:hypothetical protein [Gottfriedia luciferensis]|uniref:hypothetical protein n=1 Tax=Gottfriedia luciferensis TaxID=178774 RepID=UPI000B4350CA|nr:hypothetical protein [Gottfriedia luciferensis]